MGGIKSMNPTIRISLICLISVALLSCANNEEHSKDHHSIMENLPSVMEDSIVIDEQMKLLMQDLEKVLVDLPVNEELESSKPAARNKAFVLTRKQHIVSFPCSNCHVDMSEITQNETKDAHWDIQLNHAGVDIMACKTCHNQQSPNELVSLTGKAIDFDHSYQVCAQCHSGQAKDWLGGAHGKRVRGWINPRLINGCVSCHDPHQPSIKSRWPARLNTSMIKEREDPNR